jgi:hypothetical protein
MSIRSRCIAAGTLSVTVIVGVAVLLGGPADSSPVPSDFRKTVAKALFSGPPNYAHIGRDALGRLSADQRELIANGQLSEGEYLAQARHAASCISQELNAQVSEPRIENGRAVWSIRVGDGLSGSELKPVPPSGEVQAVSRHCHDRHLTQIERVWLSERLPQGSAWEEMRASLLRCLGVDDQL